MNRIKQRFESLRQQGRKALVSYVVMGDPAKDVTLPVMHALVESGTDIIELGIPFSDPNAEGPVIQKAHERALENGSSLRDALAKVKQFRETDSDTPVLLMGYTNPIERMGYDNFIKQAVDAGVDAVLTVDLPPEEAEEFNEHLKQANMENIFLLAPTSSPERQKKVTDMAGGFIYYVSLKGVTGAGNLDINSVNENVTSIRSLTDLPVCVGFGIKDGASARAVADLSDGVVVGSVLVNQIAMLAEQGVSDPSVYASAVSGIITEIRQALDH
ncbi:MAG: tryptophan synthase subunit alpha [Porticoccus sp.]|nr:tryptophan synthase subunit alpha [Porticoccus sp.]